MWTHRLKGVPASKPLCWHLVEATLRNRLLTPNAEGFASQCFKQHADMWQTCFKYEPKKEIHSVSIIQRVSNTFHRTFFGYIIFYLLVSFFFYLGCFRPFTSTSVWIGSFCLWLSNVVRCIIISYVTKFREKLSQTTMIFSVFYLLSTGYNQYCWKNDTKIQNNTWQLLKSEAS